MYTYLQKNRDDCHCYSLVSALSRLVVSRIDYCNAVLAGVHGVHLRQLQRVLNAAARLIVRKRKFDSISSIGVGDGGMRDTCPPPKED